MKLDWVVILLVIIVSEICTHRPSLLFTVNGPLAVWPEPYVLREAALMFVKGCKVVALIAIVYSEQRMATR